MAVIKTEKHSLCSDQEVATARQAVRKWCQELNFSLVDQTKMVTAASELGRNTVVHGCGGVMHMEMLDERIRRGLRLIFDDKGRGIADIEQAMRDGYTSGSGMGMGLGGAKRLVNEFSIESKAGEGTRVTITRWKQK